MLKKCQEFIPKSYFYLRRYSLAIFKKDLMAGITVAIVSLPLAMAFAIASGLSPEKGIFTAIVGGFIISFFGGSRVQIGGPTGAFVVIVYTIVQKHGYEGLLVATVLAGLLLILMGIFKLGVLIKFIPHPLIVGFTTGLAVVVFSAQIKDFFGLRIENVPVQFLDKWKVYFQEIGGVDFLTLAVGIGTLALIVCWRRFVRSIPWGVASITVTTLICFVFHLDIPTVASKFGDLPFSLPRPSFNFNFHLIFEMILPAITIALLAGLESLLSAVIADTAIGGCHKPNCELIAQGLANISSAIFGGMPATAAISRTATNIKTGAQTPMAGMVHAAVIFFLLFACGSIVGLIPLSALAAILITVAWDMSNIGHFYRLMKTSGGDVAILITTFLLTILVDLTVAVEIGMLLTAFLFMKRMSEVEHVIALDKRFLGKDLEVYTMRGPFFFGVIDRFKKLFYEINPNTKICVLRMKDVPILDATALQTLKELYEKLTRLQMKFILTEVQKKPALFLRQYGLEGLIDQEILKDRLENDQQKPLVDRDVVFVGSNVLKN
jgi:sulfate permease, SulP family